LEGAEVDAAAPMTPAKKMSLQVAGNEAEVRVLDLLDKGKGKEKIVDDVEKTMVFEREATR
jgi:hypothetical protein